MIRLNFSEPQFYYTITSLQSWSSVYPASVIILHLIYFFNLFCGRGGHAFSSDMQEIGFQPPRLFVARVNALRAIPAALSALLAIPSALNALRAILAALSFLRAIALPAYQPLSLFVACSLSLSPHRGRYQPLSPHCKRYQPLSPRRGRYQPLSPLVSACQLLREGSRGESTSSLQHFAIRRPRALCAAAPRFPYNGLARA